MDCCAVCEFFDGYLCRGEESPLYKRDVDPTAKCPAFVRQVAAVESLAHSLPEGIINGELDVELEVDSVLLPLAQRLPEQRRSANEKIDLDLDEDELSD